MLGQILVATTTSFSDEDRVWTNVSSFLTPNGIRHGSRVPDTTSDIQRMYPVVARERRLTAMRLFVSAYGFFVFDRGI